MQTLLGEHQDAIVAAKFLATMSADEEIEAGSVFTYGVLMANELNRAANDSCISEQLADLLELNCVLSSLFLD